MSWGHPAYPSKQMFLKVEADFLATMLLNNAEDLTE